MGGTAHVEHAELAQAGTMFRAHRRSSCDGRPNRRERAATLPEYALLVAVFVVPTMLGVQYVQNGAKSKVNAMAAGVSHGYETTTTVADGSGGSGDDGGSGTTTSTTTTTTTTTSTTTTTTTPPTTTSTTVKPTTTTTTPPTTTTVKATKSSASLSAITTDDNGSRRSDPTWWTASTTATVKDNLGKAVANATVTFTWTTYDKNGKKITSGNGTATTDSSGKATYTTSNLTWSSVYKITIDVTQITTSSGLTFDGNTTAVTSNRPT
jgi:hypothetical protein